MTPCRSSSAVVAVAVAALVLVMVTLPAVSALQCYTCHSLSDPHCDDLQANDTASSVYLKDCSETLPDKPEPFCRKTIQTTLVDGKTRVIRRCGYQKNPKDCYHYDDGDHAEVVCQCFGDACNAASGLQGGARTALAAATAAVLLLLAR